MRGNQNGKIYMTYEEWEQIHEQRAMVEARKRQNQWTKKHEADKERRHYYCNQKFLGVVLIGIALVLCFVLGDLSGFFFASMIALAGIAMILTKKMVIVNDYWWEHGGASQWKF